MAKFKVVTFKNGESADCSIEADRFEVTANGSLLLSKKSGDGDEAVGAFAGGLWASCVPDTAGG